MTKPVISPEELDIGIDAEGRRAQRLQAHEKNAWMLRSLLE